MKRKESARVISQEKLATDIYSLWLCVSFAESVRAGQFLSLFSADSGKLLPRPVSVCETDLQKGAVRLVYRIAGAGTAEFSKLKTGDTVAVMGPLGNGFPLDELTGRRVLMAGGGIGIPPMLSLGKALRAEGNEENAFAVGFRTAEPYLLDELRSCGEVFISTDDGTLGVRGTVLDALRQSSYTPDAVCACGPLPMLRAVRDYAAEAGIPAYVSLEERMACGVGVCLGCVTKTKETDCHSNVKNARVCTDGPVFRAEEVAW